MADETLGSPAPPVGMSKQEMRERLEKFSKTTGCSEEETLQLLISAEWDLDAAQDLWATQPAPEPSAAKAEGSSLTASLWSWGAKAAAAATDAVAQVDTSKISTGVNNFSSYLDSVFPDPCETAALSAAACARRCLDCCECARINLRCARKLYQRSSSSDSALKGEINEALRREEMFHIQFPEIDSHENVIDTFPCSLLQKYRCDANALTPEIPVGFDGALYVTKHHACFFLNATLHQKEYEIPLTMPFAEIAQINHKKTEEDNLIRIVVETPVIKDDDVPDEDEDEEEEVVRSVYIFTSFQDLEAFESALGILEQMFEETHANEEEEEEEEIEDNNSDNS